MLWDVVGPIVKMKLEFFLFDGYDEQPNQHQEGEKRNFLDFVKT